MGVERPRLTEAEIESLRDQLKAASWVARSNPQTWELREKLHDLIVSEATERPRGRRPKTLEPS